MKQLNIEIDFHDEIYKRTGIKPHSLTVKEKNLSANGKDYVLQVIKVNTGKYESLYLSLQDSLGEHIEDMKVVIGDETYSINNKLSQDSVVIEKFDSIDIHNIVLTSESENITINASILPERPEELSLDKTTTAQITSDELYKLLRSFLKEIWKESGFFESGDNCIDETMLVKLAKPERKAQIQGETLEHLRKPCFYCVSRFIEFYEKYKKQSGVVTAEEKKTKEAVKKKTKNK